MNRQQIIMNYSVPPSLDDLEVLAQEVFETLPEELVEFCSEIAIKIEQMPDESIEDELNLEDPFELLALYRSGKELAPGVTSKTANDDDVLVLYRRPILDLWCDVQEELSLVIREAMITELGRNFDFSEDEIEDMTRRHFQGLL
jgi:predicted Zn-dependent protease with MMP-like domain